MDQLNEIGSGFETMVAYHLLQGMRKTVPKWKNEYFGSSFAEGTFGEMLDMEIAKTMSNQKTLGIAEIIESKYRDYMGAEQND
ncbi:MAG: rod-binding protein [Planctomycetes bacterium]|nr:rod-binding protein [Planctomycetota bacterium]